MLANLREISVACFFTSYVIVLVIELLRLFGRVPGRGLLVIAMTGIGLFTHGMYLFLRASEGPGDDSGLLATWSDWSLLLALGLVIYFLILYLQRPDTIISFFFMPAVLALIGLSIWLRDLAPFTRTEAVEVWQSVHGLAMMIGSGAVLIGFLAGVMYLIQSWRLKNKRAGSALRLPTLETLGRLNRHCLITSTAAVGIGLLAGVVMNLNRSGQVGWTDRGVLFSLLLLAWLAAATMIEYFYAPASGGRKAVYLTLASLGFLILAMVGVLNSSHGRSSSIRSSSNVSAGAFPRMGRTSDAWNATAGGQLRSNDRCQPRTKSEVQTPSIGESRSDGMRPRRKHAVTSRLALAKWSLSWDWRPRLFTFRRFATKAGTKTPFDEHKFIPVNPYALAAQASAQTANVTSPKIDLEHCTSHFDPSLDRASEGRGESS